MEQKTFNFLTDKEAMDLSICWKSLYETEIAEKKVSGWFCFWQRVWRGGLILESCESGKIYI